MVQLISPTTTAEPSKIDVDYSNSTALFKFIEAKDWSAAKARVEECPDEAGSWITRRGKDGKLRWKILPLHAVLCMKAPKDIVLPLLSAYPEACSSADDQGMLPIHLAMKDDEVDEEVIKLLLKLYPEGVNTKDKEGKLPLGRPVLLALTMLQDLEREKIKTEEKTQYESKLNEELEARTTEIKKLEDELIELKDVSSHQEYEVKLTDDKYLSIESDHEKYKQLKIKNEDQEKMIASQSAALAAKEEELKAALEKLASQEGSGTLEGTGMLLRQVEKIKEVCKTSMTGVVDSMEVGKTKLNESMELGKSKLNESMEIGKTKLNESMVLGKSKLDESATVVKSKLNPLIEKITKLVKEAIAQFKDQIEKLKSRIKSKKEEKDSSEERDLSDEKDEELGTMKKSFQAFMERIIKFLNDIIAHLNEQMKKIKEKPKETYGALVEKKDSGLKHFNSKCRELFEKITTSSVDSFKHLCKERGQKEPALLTAEEESLMTN